ncbi:hypothetical protein PybrP1_004562 [[Pythium] brassicae (nom. inval.)]|nr:hypothetical protein PybrP1_004562 [[Pythium] brassicae (nom. inval.)]
MEMEAEAAPQPLDDVEMVDVSATEGGDRQFDIWSSRAQREFAKCRVPGALPVGVTLERVSVDAARGACAGEFRCFVPFKAGSDALELIPLTALRVALPFDAAAKARGHAQYPFRAPEVTVLRGAESLPPEMLARRTAAATAEQSGAGSRRLLLPSLEHWSPSNTLVMILHDFVAAVQKYDPPVVTKPAREGGRADPPPARLRMRKRDIVGKIYACQEVDPIASRLVPTPLLLQTGNVVLLLPAGRDAARDPFVYVSSVIPLKEVARITPQRGKSITLFFRDRKLSCRTFLTPDTDAIVAGLRQMIAATGVKRGRDGGSRDDDSNPLTHLLSYLSPEHTEKAKEMSSKFMGKLSKYANSVSRFLRGDDEEEAAKHRDHELFTAALDETSILKAAFFRTPSKDRMTELTRRYQSIAEEFALRRNAEGYVERAIEELQQFIEHPAARRILSETTASEQFNRGIRVGPA